MTSARAKLILLAALVLGVAWDRLVPSPFGLGFVGWVGLAVLLAFGVAWERPFAFTLAPRDRDRVLALAATFVAALGLLLRDTPTLMFFDFVTTAACAGLATWPMLGRSLGRFRVYDAVRGELRAVGTAISGAPRLLLGDVRWERPGETRGKRLRAAVIGTALAVPPVLLVGSLLGSADPIFGDFLLSWQRFGFEELAGHAAVAGVIAWPVAGWFRGLAAPATSGRLTRYAAPTRLDYFGVAPALYALVGLLAAYLGLQARALFGGAAYVERTTGLTYAEYARGGFFQLVAVTSIVLLLLLLSDWILDRRTPDADRRFRASGWILISLLGVLMASALQRMWVYVTFFGFSDTRLYATAGMAWVGTALAWFGVTILRGRRARFGVGLLVLSVTWIAGLNLVNPEAMVVRLNVARMLGGQGFDVPFHAELSADAMPVLADAAAQLPPGDCDFLMRRLSARWSALPPHRRDDDWRQWTLPRSRAERLLGRPPETLIRHHCRALPTPAP